MRYLPWLIVVALTGILGTMRVQAISDPLSVPNNKYGIHIIDANDIEKAAELVNSSGGAWGYVTMVITETDRNPTKWQGIFNELRRKKLIPILRIATQLDNGFWRKPREEDVPRWADFLNSLTWPVSNRYVVIFNEPNHAKEWGGEINPEEYTRILKLFADELHNKSEEFFVLPAGLDAAAASDGTSLDAFAFMRRMKDSGAGVWEKLDGWNSHSYPNPGFSGSPNGWGKGSIRSFLSELEFLRAIGVDKDWQIFITETGWQHSRGKTPGRELLPSETVAEYLQIADESVWRDPRIVAITPFVLNYQDYPFDHFSWVEAENPEKWQIHALAYQAIGKTAGKPRQRIEATINEEFVPGELVGQSVYTLEGELTNLGEKIIDPNEGNELILSSNNSRLVGFFAPIPVVEPGAKGKIRLILKTSMVTESVQLEVSLKTTETSVKLLTAEVQVVPPPTLEIGVQLGWRKRGGAERVVVLIYDAEEQLVFKKSDLKVENGKLTVNGVYGVIPDSTARMVVIVPGYLPRQAVGKLEEGVTKLSLRRFYPVDANYDGNFGITDVWEILRTPPFVLWNRLIGD